MAMMSVLLMGGLFWVLQMIVVAFGIGLICVVISTIVNIVSLIRKKKKSIPAIVFIIIGGVLMLPLGIAAIIFSVSGGGV